MTITDRWIRIDGELFWHDSGRQMCHRTVVATRGLREASHRLLHLLFFCGVLYNSSECFSARGSSSLALGAIVVIFLAGIHSSELLYASLFPAISSMFFFFVWCGFLTFFFFGFL